jgi:hypothetical protein
MRTEILLLLTLTRMGKPMTGAALTLAAMEACRHETLRKLTALDARRPKIAHDFCTTNSAVALQKWRELDDEADRLLERLRLFDAAVYEARARASHPDWKTQWQQITKLEIT